MKAPADLEWYDVLKAMRLERRAQRLEKNLEELRIAVTQHQAKARILSAENHHLRLTIDRREFDYWPSTGRWRALPIHTGETGRGGLRSIMREARPSSIYRADL